MIPGKGADELAALDSSWLRVRWLVPGLIAALGLAMAADGMRDALAGEAEGLDLAIDLGLALLCIPAFALARRTMEGACRHAAQLAVSLARARADLDRCCGGAEPDPAQLLRRLAPAEQEARRGGEPELQAMAVHVDLLRADLYQLLDEAARAGSAEREPVLRECERAWARYRQVTSRLP